MLKVILIFLIVLSPLHAVAPVSETLGRIQTSVAADSLTALALKAAGESYTERWLEEYAVDKVSFGEAYSELLASVLPMSNVIAGEEKGGAVALRSLDDGTTLSFMFIDGKIAAVSQFP